MKVVYRPAAKVEPAPSLFAPGMAWQRAAEEHAADMGLVVERWTVDQQFQAGGQWYRIEWVEDGEYWRVS